MSASIGGITVSLVDDSAKFQSSIRSLANMLENTFGRRTSAAIEGTENAMKRLNQSSRSFDNSAFSSLSKQALRAKNDIEGLKSLMLTLPAVAGGFGGALATQQLAQRADSYTNLKNRIASVVDGTADQISSEKELFNVAQRTRTALQSNAALFARLRSSSPALANDSDKLFRVVETVQKSFNVGGSTTAEAQSAALQLSQALGSGRLQGDELRSILENNIPLAKLIAKEFGVGIGELKNLGTEGQLTAERVIKAILDGSQEIDATFKRLKPTIESSLVVLSNGLTKSIGQFDQATGLSAGLAGGIIAIANNIDTVAKAAGYAGVALAAMFAARRVNSGVSSFNERVDDAKKKATDELNKAKQAFADSRKDVFDAVGAAKGSRDAAIGKEVDALKKLDAQKQANFASEIKALDKIDAARSAVFNSTAKDADATSRVQQANVAKQQSALEKLSQARQRDQAAEAALSQSLAQPVQGNRKGLKDLYGAAFDRDAARDARLAAESRAATIKTEMDKLNAEGPSSRRKNDVAAFKEKQSQIGSALSAANAERIASLQKYYDAEERFRVASENADKVAQKSKTASLKGELRERESARKGLDVAEKAAAAALSQGSGGKTASAAALADIKNLSRAEADLANIRRQGNLIETAQVLQRGQVDAAKKSIGVPESVTQSVNGYRAAQANLIATQTQTNLSTSKLAVATDLAKNAWAGTLGFLGGPLGFALTAASLGMTAYGVSVANAAADNERFKQNAEALPGLLERIANSGKNVGGGLRTELNASIATAEQARLKSLGDALSEVGRVATLAGSDGVKKLNDELGVTPTRGQSAEQAFRGYAARALESEAGTKSLVVALQNLGATNIDLSNPVSEALRVVGAMAAAAAQTRAAAAALAGLGNRGASSKFDYSESELAEKNINAAIKTQNDYNQTNIDLIDQANRKREVSAKIEERITAAGKGKRESRREELAGQILADSRRSGAGLSDAEANKAADQIEGIEKATADAQKRGGGGRKSGGSKGYTPAENFDNKIARIVEEGRAGFFTDLDRELISQLKELKSDPGLAKRTTDAIIRGESLPETAQRLRSALEEKKSAELARSARDSYGSLADVMPQVTERIRLLDIQVEKGNISQETRNKAVSNFVQSLPQMQQAMALADGISGGIERAFNSIAENPKKAGEAFKQLGLDLLRLGNQQFIFEPLKRGIRSLFETMASGPASSGGGFLGSLLSSIFGGGNFAQTGAPFAFGSGGYTGAGPFITAAVAHSGWGSVGSSPPATRSVSPSLFNGAPRYHSGLKTNEFAAILEEGEAVATRKQQRGIAEMINGGSRVAYAPTQPPIFNINVVGATGNDEVRRMVASGVSAGMQQVVASEQTRRRQFETRYE